MNLNAVTINDGYRHNNYARTILFSASLHYMSHGRLYSLCNAHPPPPPPSRMWKSFTSVRKAGTTAQNVEDVRLRAMAETFKTFKTI